MPTIDHSLNFEPQINTKNFWLYSRKYENTYSGVKLPGLFRTYNYTLDTFGFCLIVILEVLGMVALKQVTALPTIVILALVTADILFAILAHLPVAKICRLKNEMVLEDNPARLANLRNQLGASKLLHYIPWVIIVGLALFKILGYMTNSIFDGTTVAICLAYAVVALLHIVCTGYFLFECFNRIIFFNPQKNQVLSLGGNINHFRTQLLEESIDFIACEVNKHSIQKSDDSNQYVLKTWGVLTDDDLQAMIMRQKTQQQKMLLAKEGLRHQYHNILDAAPI